MRVRAEEQSLPEVAHWFFGTKDRWPETFERGDLGLLWYYADQLAQDLPHFVSLLRAGLLKRLYQAVSQCTRCPLSQYRLGVAVLDDSDWSNDPFANLTEEQLRAPLGAYQAQIMLVGEGPGQFEQRTGQPFVSTTVLVGSRCAQGCSNYEGCYPGSRVPKQPCNYQSLMRQVVRETKTEAGIQLEVAQERLLEIQRERSAAPFPIHTAGNILDEILLKAGLWRESWNSRIRLLPEEKRLRPAQPGNVYITNLVRCRSATPDTREPGMWAVDGLRDVSPPPKEHVAACSPWLACQLYIIQPRVLVPLGNPAVEGLLGLKDPKITQLRGQLLQGPEGLPVIPEVHPSYILRKMGEGNRHTSESRELVEQAAHTFRFIQEVAQGKIPLPWEEKQAAPGEDEDELEYSLEAATFLETTGVEKCAASAEPSSGPTSGA